jgi:hypothetical protein
MYEFLSINWFDKPLTYSDHALLRAYERELPIYQYLPITAECIKHRDDDDVYTFRFIDEDMFMVVAINKSGRVLTTYCTGCAIPKVKETKKVSLKRKKVIKGKIKEYKFHKYPFLEIESQLYDYA